MILELIFALNAAHSEAGGAAPQARGSPAACWKQAGHFKRAASDVSYKKNSDPKTKLDIYVPTNSSPPYKTVISIHGGCFKAGDKRDGWDMEEVNRFTAAGYAVVGVNYRLADPATKKNLFPASLEDVQEAVRWVRANGATYKLKTDQLIAFGYSSGATLAAYLGTRGDRVAGVIDLFGRMDFEHGRSTEKKYGSGRDCGEEYVGAPRPAANAKQFAKASVLEDVDRNAARFLILHGNKDEDVSIDHSRLLYAKLVSTSPDGNSTKRAQFVTIKGAAHMFGKPGELDQAWEKICPFLADVLGAPTPVSTAANTK